MENDGTVAANLAKLAIGPDLVTLARAPDENVVVLKPRAWNRKPVLANLGVVALAADADALGGRALHERRMLKHLRVGTVLLGDTPKRAHDRDTHHAKVLGGLAKGDAVFRGEEGRDGEDGVGAHGPGVESLDLGNVRGAHRHLRIPKHVTVVHLVALEHGQTRGRDGLLRHGAVVDEEKAAPAKEGLRVVVHGDVAQELHVVAVNDTVDSLPANQR